MRAAGQSVTAEAERVAAARRWFKRQGYDAIVADGVTVVTTPDFPDTWDANWAQAEPGATAATLSAALTQHARHSRWQVVVTDCLTDPGIEAKLALEGFTVDDPTIEMLAVGAIASAHPLPAIQVRVVTQDTWPEFAALLEADHREGRRTRSVDPQVAAGLLDGMKRRLGPCEYWLIEADGDTVGYGMTAVCPNGLGLIEHLFTQVDRRGRGLMSAFIIAAAARLRSEGCDGIFLDAHSADSPKHLYSRLGFAPVALTRTWLRDLG